LANILVGSLAEIVEWYQNGDLDEFTPTEVRSLIIALFADSPLRKEKLALIQ
jgi:hypothetical protein